MRAITIIKSEHQNLGAVLYSLEHLIDEIEDGKHADFAVFHGLFTYIDRFLDRYHHPKENDYLFPRLLARAPDTEELERRLSMNPDDSETRYQLATRRLIDEDYAAALEHFFTLLQKDRKYGDDAARKAMLQVFELLGGSGELVTRSRAKMMSVLF